MSATSERSLVKVHAATIKSLIVFISHIAMALDFFSRAQSR